MEQYKRDGMYFPKKFLWGTALAEYQNSGANSPSNWADWEATTTSDGKPHIVNSERSGIACDHWNNIDRDIKLMKDINLNACRFSFDWAAIEPQEGYFDESVLQHYVDECAAYCKANIVPMATLHHFVHPKWFEDKGGFEKRENIQYFVRFCQKVFEVLGSRIHLWCTINEPTIYAFQGYIRGVFPPGQKGFAGIVPTQLAATVLRNLIEAHVEVYKALKVMPDGDSAQIGLVHQYLRFTHYTDFIPLDRIPGFLLNTFLNDSVLKFLKTKEFNYSFSIPGIVNINASYSAAQEKKILDFIGVNYYTQVVLFGCQPSYYPGEVMTDMPFGTYPQGIHYAIKDLAELRIPIYITENGIADAQDTRRLYFFKSYLKEVSLAIREGLPVCGWFYWTLANNFEWDMGHKPEFGLYKTNFDTLEFTLQPSVRYLQGLICEALAGNLLPESSL